MIFGVKCIIRMNFWNIKDDLRRLVDKLEKYGVN